MRAGEGREACESGRRERMIAAGKRGPGGGGSSSDQKDEKPNLTSH